MDAAMTLQDMAVMNSDAMVAAGALPPLVALLSTSTSASVHEVAIYALGT